MKYAALVAGVSAGYSAHHARDETPLFDVGGLTDGVLLDFFDGFIDVKFNNADRQRYDKCYEKIPSLIKDGIELAEHIDWAHITNWKKDMQSFTEVWEFFMEEVTDIPTQVTDCSVVVEEAMKVGTELISKNWSKQINAIKNNLTYNLLTISSLGMGMVTMGIGKNYYEAGKDAALLLNAIIKM